MAEIFQWANNFFIIIAEFICCCRYTADGVGYDTDLFNAVFSII